MLTRIISGFAAFILLPVLAHSAFYITAKTSGQGSIDPPGRVRYIDNDAHPEYTIDPADGYDLSKVTYDGLTKDVVDKGDGTYTFTAYRNGRTISTLVAYFGEATYSISLSSTGNGAISTDPSSQSLTGLSDGTVRNFKITPETGFAIASITDNGRIVTPVYNGDGTASCQVTIDGANRALVAAFYLIPEVVADAGPDRITSGNGLDFAVTLDGSKSTSNQGEITYLWEGPAALQIDKPTDRTTIAWSEVPGGYEVTLTVSSGGISDSDVAIVTVPSRAEFLSANCVSCHQNRDPDLILEYDASRHSATGPYNLVACHTCHDPTSSGHASERSPTSSCYDCHSSNPDSTHATVSLADWCLQCHNTHSTDLVSNRLPSHFGGAFNGLAAQYFGENSACSDCHADGNVIANDEILAEYAASGHGDVGSPAWITTTSHDWPTGSCKRCHSTTGLIDGVTGSTTAVTAGKPGQVLACNACHVSVVTGGVRETGAYTAIYSANAITTTIEFPDAGPSNICLNCHSGRRSGAQVTETATTTPHYLAAGGTLFNVIGYEFGGRPYEAIGYHRTVGMGDKLGSGNDGPCVACHMSSGAGHAWKVVSTDAGCNIIEVASNACGACHSDMTAGKLNGKKADFRAGLDALSAALSYRGIHYHEGGFYTAPHVEGGINPAVENAYYEIVAANIDAANGALPAPSKKDLQGAAFNFYLLDHSDPAAYVHNRGYAFRLIADSIDLLNDGVIDDDVAEAIGALSLPQAVKDAAINAIRNPEPWTHSTMVESDASAGACGGCHDAAPHYGGVAFSAAGQDPAPRAQYVAQNIECIDCHVADAFTRSPINVEFAESGHGDVNGEAWKHYDWAQADRAACRRCHTATGFVNDVTGNASPLVTGEPGQVLACSGCHENLAGGVVRMPGAYTATYSNDAGATLLDLGWSNICVRCHSGRESGDSIKNSAGDFTDLGFINSHYLATTATLYRNGYNFAGLAYNNPPFISHPTLGIGNGGPCVGCHMYSIEGHGHTFETVRKNEGTGAITAIVSDICGYCHSFTPADLTAKATGMAAVLDALEAQLAIRGIHFYPVHPYFYFTPFDETPGATNTALRNWESVYPGKGKDVMGAAFNFNLLYHEPGAYAHNQLYARRLVFDSIDILDNGVLNGSIDLSDHPVAAAYLKPAATASAVTRP